MILDSTYIIDLIRGTDKAYALSIQLEDKAIHTTSITVFEVIKGIINQKELEKARILFDTIPIIEFDSRAAIKAGKIHRDLMRRGEEIDPEDCMIAAIALLNDEVLVTNNVKHFRRVKGLMVKGY